MRLNTQCCSFKRGEKERERIKKKEKMIEECKSGSSSPPLILLLFSLNRVKRKKRDVMCTKNALQCDAGYRSNLKALIRPKQNKHVKQGTEFFDITLAFLL